jgi:sugar phosphate isomerase/epimerase
LQDSVDAICNKIPVFFSLGIKKIVLPLLDKSLLTESNWLDFLAPLQQIADIAKLYNIEICIEANCCPSLLRNFFEVVDRGNICLCLDTGNLVNVGQDPVLTIKILADRIRHVHIKDRGKNGDNVTLGQGVVVFHDVVKELVLHNYSGTFTFESVRGLDPIATMKLNLEFIKNIFNKTK